MQPLTATVFEHVVLSKPYFDRHGLIVAEREGRPVGFVHAAFGPNEDKSSVGTDVGVICILQLLPEIDGPEIRNALISQAETYLSERGANTILGGGVPALSPYYLGLYGGSELPGVLDSDVCLKEALQSAGYTEAVKFHTLNCRLTEFRPPFDRSQHMLSRQFRLEVELDRQFDTWWDSCTLGMTQHCCFHLVGINDGRRVGSVNFWDIEPLASSWGIAAVGLSRLRIAAEHRGKGLGTFLISHSLRYLHGMSTALAEVQVSAEAQSYGLFRRLGFEPVDSGVSFVKRIR